MEKEYEIELPEYVTTRILKRIRVMMEQGRIHPRNHSCDMTAEIAAGAPLREALEHMVRRAASNQTDSIYQQLFPQRGSYR